MMFRLFGSGAKSGVVEVVSGTSMLNEDISGHDDDWYGQQLAKLGKGIVCTKVGTNGKPYERRVHVDSRNLTIEIRGGRGGATGILLDDLTDLRKGLSSKEFELFCHRFKKE